MYFRRANILTARHIGVLSINFKIPPYLKNLSPVKVIYSKSNNQAISLFLTRGQCAITLKYEVK